MKDCPVAVIQTECKADIRACREAAETAVRKAAAGGAKLVLLPELYHAMRPKAEMAALCEPVPGPSSERWGKLARELGLWLVAGTVPERAEHQDRFFNTALVIDDRGELVAKYRKLHRFDVEVPGVVRFCESESVDAGSEIRVVPTPWGILGLAICYDLRFPEMFRALSDRGAEIIAVPSAFSQGTGLAHWHTLVKARAIENQAFVLAPNQCGCAPNGFQSFGHSLIVDPWGRVLEEAAQSPASLEALLSAALLDDTRTGLPALKHRRRDLWP